MENLVKVTLALEPTDAAKLVHLAGGEENINEYAAEIIRSLPIDESAASTEAQVEQTTEAEALIDLYG
jgi:phosphotransferase system IIB component